MDEKTVKLMDEQEPIPSHILERMEECRKKGMEVPDPSLIKRPAMIQGIIESSKINTGVLDTVAAQIHDGMSTQEIDDIVSEYTLGHGAVCAPLHFEGYPKSVCTSINEEVCHGIPSRHRKLHDGDIVNVDVSTIYNGWYSDASRMFMIGQVSEARRKLVEETKKCLEAGLAAAKPWATVGDIGYAVSKYAHSRGYSVVRELGGHGVGIEFHEDPFVSHVGKQHTGMVLVPGMIFTIEPMINAGKAGVVIDPYNNWTIYTNDGKDSAQWEHTILITETGNEILTY
ncbi:MAG: type I methionyl aminopeptidase [Solobacterium sp.]|jgi:methionyl aminopeptidase|nr:type I methionyl aminopeptidase [Solobacterium sp.]MCH4222915.1 type I methionyl aminopeptidase [Solobacterium sp.]